MSETSTSTGPVAPVEAGTSLPPRVSPRTGPGNADPRFIRPRRKGSASDRQAQRTSLILVVPSLVLIAVFIVYPVVDSVRLSFFTWDGLTQPVFIGVKNFLTLFRDSDFLVAISNNFLFAVLVTVGTVVLGTIFALAVDGRVRFWRFYRFVYFLPNVLPGTIIAIMWSNALDPNYGWLSHVIAFFVPSASGGLLANQHTAIYVICFAAIWQVTGFPMVVILGGLQNIPHEVKEAALLDGASPLRRAWHITIPMTKDVLATITLLQLIFSFKVFDIVQALTKGGPGIATQVLGTLIYRDAFQQGQYGYGSAIAVVASVAIMIVSLIYLAILRPGRIEKNG